MIGTYRSEDGGSFWQKKNRGARSEVLEREPWRSG